MSSSNSCFLTFIQVSQEAGQVVWYSHLFQNFPQFIVIHTVRDFGIVNKAEIHVFLELSCFFNDPADFSNLISGSTAFSKTSLNIYIYIYTYIYIHTHTHTVKPSIKSCFFPTSISLIPNINWTLFCDKNYAWHLIFIFSFSFMKIPPSILQVRKPKRRHAWDHARNTQLGNGKAGIETRVCLIPKLLLSLILLPAFLFPPLFSYSSSFLPPSPKVEMRRVKKKDVIGSLSNNHVPCPLFLNSDPGFVQV